MSTQFPRVSGLCPMGCGETLFLGAGGHITCSYIPCPNPCAADEMLATSPLFQTIRESVERIAREIGELVA